MSDFSGIVGFIKTKFPGQKFVPLHEPRFTGNERKYVMDAIDSTFVSSVGAYVNKFEEMMAQIAGSKYAVATNNGTSALHMAMIVAGVKREDEVITQAVTFIATANAIAYTGAEPVFVDIDRETLGMNPVALEAFLKKNAEIRKDGTFNRVTGKRIAACVPMHTFGFPCDIERIAAICQQWNIVLIEDAAESLGSSYNERHTGSFGLLGTFSFNGNKTVTCGGGGAIVTNDETLAKLAKHLTTQAKTPHPWEFNHDHIGYNYRLPNLNAAMACAQLEQLENFIENKRALASEYAGYFSNVDGVKFRTERSGSKANYWLNVLEFNNLEQRDYFLKQSNENGVMTRPCWTLMNELPMFRHCQHDGLIDSRYISERIVNIPSSVRI